MTRRTASAAPGRSVRKRSGSSTTCTTTSVAARTVAVAGCRRTTAISPKIAPGRSMRANGTPSRSTVTVSGHEDEQAAGVGALLDEGGAGGDRLEGQVGRRGQQGIGHGLIVPDGGSRRVYGGSREAGARPSVGRRLAASGRLWGHLSPGRPSTLRSRQSTGTRLEAVSPRDRGGSRPTQQEISHPWPSRSS